MEQLQEKLLNELKSAGVDVDGTVSRFMDNSEIYIKFLKRFPDEDRFTPVKEAIAEKDFDKLNKTAHKLKGVSANLGMTALSEAAHSVELKAKENSLDGVDGDMENVEKLYNEVCGIIRENT